MLKMESYFAAVVRTAIRVHGVKSYVWLSSMSKSGDKGPGKNFRKKVKKEEKKNREIAVTDLLSSLKSFEKQGRVQASEMNERETDGLREFLSNIKPPKREVAVGRDSRPAKVKMAQKTTRKQLFVHGPRLGIFSKPSSDSEVMPEVKLDFGEEDRRQQVELLMKLRAKNDFEGLMEKSDRLWSYPVDNEVVKKSEENVGFEEHVLLDHLLKDVPKRGPVRKFMEMVVTGLSRNPYYSVQEKHQQVAWYKDYFSKFSEDDLMGITAADADGKSSPTSGKVSTTASAAAGKTRAFSGSKTRAFSGSKTSKKERENKRTS